MKKIIAVCLALLSIISLSGCKSSTTVVDKSALSSEIATSYLNDITYNEVACNEFTATKAHYSVYLPTDISSSLRLNVLSVESSITDSTKAFSFAYASPSDFTTSTKTAILKVFKSSITNDSLGDLGFDLSFPTAWTFQVNFDSKTFGSVSGKTREVYTVYMPAYVEYYEISDKEAKCVLQSYVLIPVAYGTVYNGNAGLEGIDSDIISITRINLANENGVLK